MSHADDVWGTGGDGEIMSEMGEGDDDDEDDFLGPRVSATIKYVELPAKYDDMRVRLVKLNEATCPGCITACRRAVAISTVSVIFLVAVSVDVALSIAEVRKRASSPRWLTDSLTASLPDSLLGSLPHSLTHSSPLYLCSLTRSLAR
jgi:hypothetical protein